LVVFGQRYGELRPHSFPVVQNVSDVVAGNICWALPRRDARSSPMLSRSFWCCNWCRLCVLLLFDALRGMGPLLLRWRRGR